MNSELSVIRLTETHEVLIGERQASCEPLLIQLREARYPNLGRTKGGGGSGDMLDMKAVTMYETIDAGVRTWLDHFRQTSRGNLLDETRRLYQILLAEHAGGRLEESERLFSMFDTWVARIEELFDPPKDYELTAACPDCGTEHTVDADGGQRWAVRIPVKEGRGLIAECHECGSMWGGHEALTGLAESMGVSVDWVALREFVGDTVRVGA